MNALTNWLDQEVSLPAANNNDDHLVSAQALHDNGGPEVPLLPSPSQTSRVPCYGVGRFIPPIIISLLAIVFAFSVSLSDCEKLNVQANIEQCNNRNVEELRLAVFIGFFGVGLMFWSVVKLLDSVNCSFSDHSSHEETPPVV